MAEFWACFVVTCVTGAGVTLLGVLRQGMGFRLVSAQQPPWHRVKCGNCDGVGILWLYGGQLMIVPGDRRSRRRDGWHPGLANAVPCSAAHRRPGVAVTCHGFGFIRVRDDKPVPRDQR